MRSCSEAETFAIGRELGALLVPGDTVALTGDLGAGKTVFCKGVGAALGIPAEAVVSPSFTLAAEHRGALTFHHVDAYRLRSAREAEEAGLDELFWGDGICAVEWADRVERLLPSDHLKVRLGILSETARLIEIAGSDEERIGRLASRCERYIEGGIG